MCGECGRNLAQAFFVLEIQSDDPVELSSVAGILVHECFPSFRGDGGGSAGLVVCGVAAFLFLVDADRGSGFVDCRDWDADGAVHLLGFEFSARNQSAHASHAQAKSLTSLLEAEVSGRDRDRRSGGVHCSSPSLVEAASACSALAMSSEAVRPK